MNRKKLETKFKEIYPLMMGVCIRYGIPADFLQDQFIKHNKLKVNDFKNKMILDWSKSKKEPVVHETENIFMAAMNNLDPLERLIYNMKTVEEYQNEVISDILKIENEIINNTYINAQEKIKKDEKIIWYLNSDVGVDNILALSV